MHTKAKVRCEICGETILEGKRLCFNNGIEERDDGIDGEYREGSGRCEVCGRDLCAEHGGFEAGVCVDCREQEAV
jgi:ribosomal protein S14